MGKAARNAAASAFCALLERSGIRAYPRTWKLIRVVVEGIPADHELILELDQELRIAALPTPRTLKAALEVWHPRLVWLAPAIIRRQDSAMKPFDRERVARWLWWSALHNARLVADPPPASWAEVALTSEEAALG